LEKAGAAKVMDKYMDLLTYWLIRSITFPLTLLSYKNLHRCGRFLGSVAYYLLPKWRKQALSNIALVLPLQSPPSLAKASFQSLMITALEYAKLAKEKDITRLAHCDNPEEATAILNQGKGLIFFCGHQANWEILFLEGNTRWPGVAIGRPIKNRYLYTWIQNMRERFGGTMIIPKQAVKEGLRALRKGKFLGIVGDQGMPDSGYSSPFLGRLAWTSPLPAILSIRSGAPLMVASIAREKGKYRFHCSPPLYPRHDVPMQEEVDRLMREALQLFEQSILQVPEQWLWIHNRWKQQPPGKLKRAYRHDAIAIIFPDDEALVREAAVFRELYPTEFIVCFVPRRVAPHLSLQGVEVQEYEEVHEVVKEDYRFKLLFNFTPHRYIDRHYKKFSVLHAVHLEDLEPGDSLERRLKPTILYAP
jgi:KDO2-lipid IV(A) lauroyltransferase